MDIAKLILTEPVSLPSPLENLSQTSLGKEITKLSCCEADNVSEDKKKQAAKDFESVLINKLLDAMQSTIGQLGLEQDAASGQIQGIFSLYLSRHIANNGGFGLWKDIYQFITNAANTSTTAQSLDKNV
jgi:Rod binding domain-containing protein